MKKLINLTLLFLLILGIYSCLKDEFQLSGSNEKSAGEEKDLIEAAQNWYLANPSKNDYSLIHVSEKLKWSQAIVHQLDTATIVEIPIKLKENNSLKIKYEYELNIEQRLLIINNGNQTYSLLEFFISTDSKENLSNIKKLNFIENKDYFEGTLLLVNSAGESVMAKQIENVEESAEFKLKSIEVRCLVLVYEYSDGTYDIISVLYCYEIDNGVDGGGGGNPSYTDPYDCGCNICPVCGGCIIDELKSIPIPPEDGGETTIDCPACSCPVDPQLIICEAYYGTVDIENMTESVDNFLPYQEQFIISLANLAALYQLGYSLEGLKNDLTNYSINSSLHTKMNKLNNPENYISNWEPAYNSYTDEYDASISPILGGSGFQLKFYPEKNGEYNAIGLVKDGVVAHNLEAALESIDGFLRDNLNLADDIIYDMHLFNALNFMDYYCND